MVNQYKKTQINQIISQKDGGDNQPEQNLQIESTLNSKIGDRIELQTKEDDSLFSIIPKNNGEVSSIKLLESKKISSQSLSQQNDYFNVTVNFIIKKPHLDSLHSLDQQVFA